MDGYDYDDEFRDNPLMSEEALYYMNLCNAVSTGTAYEKFEYDPDGYTAGASKVQAHR